MRSRSAVSQSYVDTQLMIPRKSSAAGIPDDDDEEEGCCAPVPYFFGWSFHPPSSADILSTDPTSLGKMNLYSTLVPCATEELTIVTYRLLFPAFTALIFDCPGSGSETSMGFNTGLYDAQGNLLTETGFIDVRDSGTTQKSGTFNANLITPVSLSPGHYYEAFASNCCMRIYAIGFNSIIPSIMAESSNDAIGGVSPPRGRNSILAHPVGAPTDCLFAHAFPEAIDLDSEVIAAGVAGTRPCPLILFSGAPE